MCNDTDDTIHDIDRSRISFSGTARRAPEMKRRNAWESVCRISVEERGKNKKAKP